MIELWREIFKSSFSLFPYSTWVYKGKPPPQCWRERGNMGNARSMAEPLPEYNKVDAIVQNYSCEKSALIAILQEIENFYGYLPVWALRYLSEKLDVPMVQVYGVASFYDAFHLTPQGKHLIRVCLGTACYLRGSARVLEAVEKELGIEDGETTPDLEFSIQSVRCLGACALAPVMIIGDRYFDKMTPTKVSGVLKRVRRKNEKD